MKIHFLNETVESVEIERRKVDKLYITHTLCITFENRLSKL